MKKIKAKFRFPNKSLAFLITFLLISALILTFLKNNDNKYYLVNKPGQYKDISEMLNSAYNILNGDLDNKEYKNIFPEKSKFTDCTFNILKNSKKYLIFDSICNNGGGNRYLAIKENKKWVVITGMGQELPYCQDLRYYSIPEQWYENCIDSGNDGETLIKNGKLKLN